MKFTFTVEVEVEFRGGGKFAPKDELAEMLADEIRGADPGSVTGMDDGEYEVVSFEVDQQS